MHQNATQNIAQLSIEHQSQTQNRGRDSAALWSGNDLPDNERGRIASNFTNSLVERIKRTDEVLSWTTQRSSRRFKILRVIGFYWGFLKPTQNMINSDYGQKLHHLGICNDLKSLYSHKSVPNNTRTTRTRGFFTYSQEEGREEHKSEMNQKLQLKQKRDFNSTKPTGRTRFPSSDYTVKIVKSQTQRFKVLHISNNKTRAV
jgi:hypothetical protein